MNSEIIARTNHHKSVTARYRQYIWKTPLTSKQPLFFPSRTIRTMCDVTDNLMMPEDDFGHASMSNI